MLSSQSRRTLTLILRFLSFFIVGGAVSGDNRVIAGCGVRAAGGVAMGDVAQARTSGAVVALVRCMILTTFGALQRD